MKKVKTMNIRIIETEEDAKKINKQNSSINGLENLGVEINVIDE